jgi:hypothetical protein
MSWSRIAVSPKARLEVMGTGNDKPIMSRIGGPLLLAILSLLALGLFISATRRGLALGSDSAAYFAAARNLTRGYGLSWLSGGVEIKPLVLHAPLYPITLAAFESFSIDSAQASRFINAVAYSVTIPLFSVIVFRLTNSRTFSLFGALILISTGEFFQVYAWAMSDPLYIALSLASLVFMLRFLENQRTLFFVIGVFAASCAYLARYTGLSLIVALSLLLLVAPSVSIKRRLIRASIFFSVGILPTSMWFLRNWLVTGQIAGRTFGRNASGLLEGSTQAMSIILNWFLPLNLVEWLQVRTPILSVMGLIGILGLGLVVVFCVRAWSNRMRTRQTSAVTTLGIYILTYLGLMGYSYLFSRPGTDLIERTFSPIYPLLLAMLVKILHWIWEVRWVWLRAVIVLAYLILLRNKALYTYHVVDGLINNGQGYTSNTWRESETIKTMNELSPDLVYTDDIAAVYLLSNTNVYLVPLRLDLVDGSPRSDYENNLRLMHQRIEHQQALLVLFEPDSLLPEMASFDRLVDGLDPIAVFDDGVIYGRIHGVDVD